MKFSDRIKVTKAKSISQINDMDTSLRNKLWDVVCIHLTFPLLRKEKTTLLSRTKYYIFFTHLWHLYFKRPIDTIPNLKNDAITIVREHIFNCTWFEVYNFIEFINNNPNPINKEKFKQDVNHVLKTELAGYKFVGNKLIPITAKIEIKEIEDSLSNAKKHRLEGVQIHINTAIKILSNKTNPDYRNVIKESISAVEAISQLLANDKKAELGKTLGILKNKINIHGALEQGFKKIYGYSSDADGIRHALLEKDNLDIEDAKYMLISCSAFINYLIIKAEKAEIL